MSSMTTKSLQPSSTPMISRHTEPSMQNNLAEKEEELEVVTADDEERQPEDVP